MYVSEFRVQRKITPKIILQQVVKAQYILRGFQFDIY